jgi:hypothetical protein
MAELYWITRLDGVIAFLVVLAILFLFYGIGLAVSAWYEGKHTPKHAIKLITGALVCVLALVFIPSTKDALVIYGIGGTIDYIKQNETFQGLPDKTVKCLDRFLDEYLEPKEKESHVDKSERN